MSMTERKGSKPMTERQGSNNGALILDIKEQADLISNKMKVLQRKCRKVEQKMSISMKEIFGVINFMEKHLYGEHSGLFHENFIGHLKVIQMLAEDNAPPDFYEYVEKIAKSLCNLFPKIHAYPEFAYRVAKHWHSCLLLIPKHIMVKMTKVRQLKNYGKCLIEASTNSLQSKVLDIIYAYCKNSPDSVELLKKAFEDIPLRMDIDDLISLVCDDFLGNQMLLYHFNNRLLHQHIHSEMVYTLRLGNKVYNCDADNGRFVHFNRKSIEFWLPYDRTDLKVIISGQSITKVLIETDDSPYIQVIAVELQRKPIFETINGRHVKVDEFGNSNLVMITFVSGYKKTLMNELLVEMLGIDADKLGKFVEEKPQQIPQLENYDDHSIEFIPNEIESNRSIKINDDVKKSQNNVEKTTNEHFKLPRVPIKPEVSINSSKESAKQAKEKTSKLDTKNLKRKCNDFPVTTLELSDIMIDSANGSVTVPSKKAKLIESKTKPSKVKDVKPIKPEKNEQTPVKRPIRNAAVAATKRMASVAVDAYTFNDLEPPLKIKKTSLYKRKRKEPIGPVIIIPPKIGKQAPRKLFNPHQSDDELNEIELKVDKKPKKNKSIWDVEPVTRESFNSSILNDNSRLMQRFQQNIDRINDKGKTNPQNQSRISFSYKDLGATRKQVADSTIASVGELQLPSVNQQIHGDDAIELNDNSNIDMNGNYSIDRSKKCKKCQRDQLLSDGVKRISNICNNIIQILTPNNCDCH